MKIKFYGASQTVTGSCYIIEAAGARFAVDCGMHQGNSFIEERNWNSAIYHPRDIDFILITHAHIDHSGLLPRLVKDGYKNKIYATPPTCELLEIMLLDSAHIQEMEALWQNKKRHRQNRKSVEPLYTENDAMDCTALFSPVVYNQAFQPCPGITVTYHDAGHILGSAFILIEAEENGKKTTLLFSGDLGRPGALLMNDPSKILQTDYLFMEGTYGNRNHKDMDTSLDELAEAIMFSHDNGKKVIIPAFAVERSQEMIYCLHLLNKRGQLPPDMPVFLDSPMAISATELFRRHPEYLDAQTKQFLAEGEDPLDLPNLHFTRTSEESRAINDYKGPAIIISASGMCNAGRIKHHLKHNLSDEGASVIFVGFQAEGTPGRAIVDGAKQVRLFGESISINAKIYTIGGFSAHAGQSQLLEWVKPLAGSKVQIFLIHGELTALKTLSDMLNSFYNFRPITPEYLSEYTLVPGTAPLPKQDPAAQVKIDWPEIVQHIQTGVQGLDKLAAAMSNKPIIVQVELRDRLASLGREIKNIIAGN